MAPARPALATSPRPGGCSRRCTRSRTGATPFISDDGTKLTVNEDIATKTLAYIQKLSKTNLLAPTADYAGAETLMFTGKSGFYFEGPWEITTAQGIQGLKFGIVPVPQLFDKVVAQADSHAFVLPRMERTPEQMARAMGFMKSMLEQSMTWAKGGHIPAYRPTRDSAEYKALLPQANYASAADERGLRRAGVVLRLWVHLRDHRRRPDRPRPARTGQPGQRLVGHEVAARDLSQHAEPSVSRPERPPRIPPARQEAST